MKFTFGDPPRLVEIQDPLDDVERSELERGVDAILYGLEDITPERVAMCQMHLMKVLRAMTHSIDDERRARMKVYDPTFLITGQQLGAIQDSIWECLVEHGPITKVKSAAMKAIGDVVCGEMR